jgi:hypothetical protein
MFNSFSNSFKMNSYKTVAGVILSLDYTQFVYTLGGVDQTKYVLLDSPNPYPIQFTGGGVDKTEGLLNTLTNSSFTNKNRTLYFRSNIQFDGFNYGASLFYMGANPVSNTDILSFYKNNEAGTLYKLYIKSNSATPIEDNNVTNQLGAGSDMHIFVRISATNTLQCTIYDIYGDVLYSSAVKTIDSATFGNAFNTFSLNHDAKTTTANVVRQNITQEAGYWNKYITDTEMTDHLALTTIAKDSFVQFTYTQIGNTAWTLLNSPNPYPIQFTSGYAFATYNELSASSFANKNTTVYYKSRFDVDGSTKKCLFLMAEDSAVNTGAICTMTESVTNATSMIFKIKTNGVSIVDTV